MRGRETGMMNGRRCAVRWRARSTAAAVLALAAAAGPVAFPAPVFARSAAAAQAARPMPLMMTVGCVEAGDRGVFRLTRATEPEAIADRLPPVPAPSAALGSGEIRLIGTLDEFGIADHVGRKIWAKGLLVEDETERRLNVVSITRLSPSCE